MHSIRSGVSAVCILIRSAIMMPIQSGGGGPSNPRVGDSHFAAASVIADHYRGVSESVAESAGGGVGPNGR